MFSELRKKAGVSDPESIAEKPDAAEKEDSPETSQEETTAENSPGPEEKSEETSPAKPSDKPADPEKKAKVNPWKLSETYKKRVQELENEVAGLKTKGLAETEKNQYLARIQELEKKSSEMEEEIRFSNYEKSDEFKTKYQKPYVAAIERALVELSEIPVIDPATGETRPANANDLMSVVQLPLAAAKEQAEKLFGDFAEEAMSHRKEIKGLFQAQAQALKQARENGSAREKEHADLAQKAFAETSGFIRQTWEAENRAATKNDKVGRYFSQEDGDEDGNQRLTNGFSLVDKYLTANPFDPKLSKEQRAEIVRGHAAIRNRAAAFGRLVSRLEKATARITELEGELGKFKRSTPPRGGDTPPTQPPRPKSAREEVFGELRRLAQH